MDNRDERQCVRYNGSRSHCSNMALPGSIYCDKHCLEREKNMEERRKGLSSKKRRKGPKKEIGFVTHLPSGDLRCRRNGGSGWQCPHKATYGLLYCHKHGLREQTRCEQQRKGPPRPSRTLNLVLSLSNHSGNEGSTTRKGPKRQSPGGEGSTTRKGPKKQSPVGEGSTTRKGPKKQSPVGEGSTTRKGPKKQTRGGVRCRRAGCDELASPGIFCQTHQSEQEKPKESNNIRDALSNPNSNDSGEEVSSGAVKPGREAAKRCGGRKRLRDKETISADLVSGLGEMVMKKRRGVSVNNEHEESGQIGTQETASSDNEPTCEPDVEITSEEAAMKFQETQGLLSVTNCYMAVEGHTSTREQVHLEKTSEVTDDDIEITHDHVDIEKHNQIKGIGPDNITITCATSPMKCQNSQNLSHDAQLQNAIDDEQNDAVMLPFWSDYNSHEELHENGGLSFVTDEAINAVDFSCEQMEAENDIMEVLAGVQSTVYVGDIPIPAEYEQIYKEIKDLHGPLENGESVGEKISLSHETLVELLKVAHELGGLTMESMTETTILNFKRTVAIGKLFNYNVGWLDENLKRLSDFYAKRCAVGGELEQLEREITKKKHEEDILKLEVDEIDENVRVLEESINKMKQKREMIEMEKKKKYSNVSSLQERILETSERVRDTSIEFYRIAAKPW